VEIICFRIVGEERSMTYLRRRGGEAGACVRVPFMLGGSPLVGERGGGV